MKAFHPTFHPNVNMMDHGRLNSSHQANQVVRQLSQEPTIVDQQLEPQEPQEPQEPHYEPNPEPTSSTQLVDPKNPPYPWIYPRFHQTIMANSRRLKDDRIVLFTVDDFLDDNECSYIKKLIDENNRPSTIVGGDREPDKYYRTSSTCDLCNLNDDYINGLEKRMGDYVGLDHDYAEGMQGQYYKYKQEFKTHTDYFEPGTDDYQKEAAVQGQRTWTFMLYLNDVEEGGETKFKNIDKTFYPKKGRGVIWMNSNIDGTPNSFTEHQGSPVIKGEKYIITKWFRERNSDDVPAKLMLHRQLPVWTPQGFYKTQIPYPLFELLQKIYLHGADRVELEDRTGLESYIYHHTKRPEKNESITHLIPIRDNEKEYVERSLQPLLESWVGQPLTMTSTFGIRVYTRGAILHPHVDRFKTHIVSAILNVAQDIEKPWPLVIQDHLSREHTVYLQPGEMVLYESSRLKHGRPYPLEGNRFANVFVHAKPKFWDEFTQKIEQDLDSGLLVELSDM